MGISEKMVNDFANKIERIFENEYPTHDFEDIPENFWEECMWEDYTPQNAVFAWFNFGRYRTA